MTLFLAAVWVAAQALEMSATDLPTKIIWANIQYIPIMLTPVTYLYLALELLRKENWLQKRWLTFVLLIAPACQNILAWTNGAHGLIRQNVYLDVSGVFPTVAKTYGPLFWVFAVCNYIVSFLSMINLAGAFKERSSIYRKQLIFLFIAILLPVISNLIQIFGLNPFRVDITPSALGASAMILSWGIYRYRLFDVIPIARSIIIQEMRAGMIVLDNEGRFLDINPAAARMLSLSSENLFGRKIEEILTDIPDLIRMFKEGKDSVFEMAVRNKENNHCYEISFTQISNSKKEFIGWLLQIYDITERKLAEEIIQHAAYHDSLTGLPNRDFFQILFSHELSRARLRCDPLTVAFLDLDNFKGINDTFGHDAGDTVLCEVAKRLKGVLRESDVISRIGGDEFSIVLPHVGSDDKIETIGNKILQAFKQNVDLREGSVPIRASIGFSVFPRDGDSITVLLKKADKAMYQTKGGVKNSFCIYR